MQARKCTFDTKRAKKLIYQIDNEIWHFHALSVIPLIAPASCIRIYDCERQRKQKTRTCRKQS
jgi:hypothetical protein